MRSSTLSIIILSLLHTTGAFAENPKAVKGLWVVRDVLKSKSDIQKMLADAEKAHITDLFVQVRGRADAYYKSDLVPMADGLDGSFDPLEYLLARSSKFKVHAWLNVFYLWSSETGPSSKEHLLFTRAQWSAVSSSGISMIEEGLKSLKEKNKEGYFISPANSDFQEYFLKVIDEIVSRYKIDGIHLDYIRYAGAEYDYSEAMRSKFILSYHSDPLQMIKRINLDGKKTWFDNAWAEFRRKELTTFVSNVHTQVVSKSSNIRVSAAVWADLNMAKNELFQDWTEWLKKGYIDLAVPMNYATDNNVFERRIKDAQSALPDSVFYKKVIMGISMYNQTSAAMNEKIEICRKYGMPGISFFSYESVRKDRSYFQKMAETVYRQ